MMMTMDERTLTIKNHIPFEVVDDDELAAIESAFTQVHRPLSQSNSCPPSQAKRTIAESCNSWLVQCSKRKGRSLSLNRQIGSVLILKQQTTSSTLISRSSDSLRCENSDCPKIRRRSQGSSCSCSDKENSQEATQAVVERFRPGTTLGPIPSGPSLIQGESSEPPIQEPEVTDIEELVLTTNVTTSLKGDGDEEPVVPPPEPKPRSLSVTDFTALFIKYMLPDTHCLKRLKGGLWNNLFSVWAPPGGLANPEPLEGVHLPEANHHDSLHLTDMSLVFLARQPLAWVDQSAGLNRSMEWCEKQVEFTKTLGKPKRTAAMKAGSARHAILELEVVTRVEVEIVTKEDNWAMRFLNFVTGARQLQSEGMTRELPVLGVIEGAWVIGIIDELKMCERDGKQQPLLIDTKTRFRPTPPSAPQKQNGRMQLMVYKLLWDNLVTVGIPFDFFFEHFKLRPQEPLSNEIQAHAAEVFPGVKVETLQDVSMVYSQECHLLPECHEDLLLRYEWQEDGSLLGQDEFLMWREWLDLRVHWHLEFWHGQRDAAYVPEDELWKCRYCAFADLCPQVKALNLQIEPKKKDEEPPKPSPPKIVDQIAQEPPKPKPPKKVDQKPQEPLIKPSPPKKVDQKSQEPPKSSPPKKVDQKSQEPPKSSPPKKVDKKSQEPPKPSPPKKVVQKSQEPIGSQGIMKYFKKNTPS